MKDTQLDTASQNDDATPETDESTFSAEDHRGDIFNYIEPDFARRLERERNLAKGQAIYWQDKATQFAKERDEAREQLKEVIGFARYWKDETKKYAFRSGEAKQMVQELMDVLDELVNDHPDMSRTVPLKAIALISRIKGGDE